MSNFLLRYTAETRRSSNFFVFRVVYRGLDFRLRIALPAGMNAAMLKKVASFSCDHSCEEGIIYEVFRRALKNLITLRRHL